MAENSQTNEQEQEAIQLKTLAESKFDSSELQLAVDYASRAHELSPNLPGLVEMLTAFKILNSSQNPRKTLKNVEYPFPSPDLYDILGVTPFSSLSIIKARYKKLALLLHPDKSTLKNASEEAFKVVNDAFQVFSDKGKRREYDTRLRLALLEEREESEEEEVVVEVAMFWSKCPKCRLRHRFERKYVGQRLVCPSCEQGFDAVEVVDNTDDEEEEVVVIEEEGEEEEREDAGSLGVRKSARIGARKVDVEEEVQDWEMSSLSELLGKGKWKERSKVGHKKVKRKMSNTSEVVERAESVRVETPIVEDRRRSYREKSKKDDKKLGKSGIAMESEAVKLRVDERKKRSGVAEKEVEKSKNDERSQVRSDDLDELESVSGEVGEEVEDLTLAEMKMAVLSKSKGKKSGGKRKVTIRQEVEEELVLNKKKRILAESRDLEVMTVEDSEFYDFDEDRVERSFKKGQVWAIYDDDDGMPRHYGLIDEVVSVNPFVVKMSWLDFQNDGDERLVCWEKRGFHVSCGKFKVARKDDVVLLNIFSHLVECERAARELYRIYPRKGSVWALYNEMALDAEGRKSPSTGRHYDIVVFLTTYSDIHGLSMAYLVKVDGYRAVFNRQEIGYNAVRWLEKEDIRLFSHQIPARKLSGDDAPQQLGDCWELDPASLPHDLLAVTSTK